MNYTARVNPFLVTIRTRYSILLVIDTRENPNVQIQLCDLEPYVAALK